MQHAGLQVAREDAVAGRWIQRVADLDGADAAADGRDDAGEVDPGHLPALGGQPHGVAALTTRQVDQIFTGTTGVAHYQLRQKPDGSAHLLLLPATEGDGLSSAQAKLTAELGHLLGTTVTAETVGLIAPEDSGKFRLTVREAA